MRWLDWLLGRRDENPYTLPPRRWRARKADDGPTMPADPRPSGRDVVAEGWSCPAVVGGSVCGLPKTPEAKTCGRPRCKAWATRQAADRPAKRGKVLPIRRGLV
jgi:hypothetical protein